MFIRSECNGGGGSTASWVGVGTGEGRTRRLPLDPPRCNLMLALHPMWCFPGCKVSMHLGQNSSSFPCPRSFPLPRTFGLARQCTWTHEAPQISRVLRIAVYGFLYWVCSTQRCWDLCVVAAAAAAEEALPRSKGAKSQAWDTGGWQGHGTQGGYIVCLQPHLSRC